MGVAADACDAFDGEVEGLCRKPGAREERHEERTKTAVNV